MDDDAAVQVSFTTRLNSSMVEFDPWTALMFMPWHLARQANVLNVIPVFFTCVRMVDGS